MKRIVKTAAPTSFTQWKALANEDWVPTYADLQNPEKRDLHEALLAEQGWLCCYCGRSIELDDSHIEHFRPQDAHGEWADLQLEYENLHASCVRETKPDQPLHCGHAKGSRFEEAAHVSPVSEDCEQRFVYTLSGEEVAADRQDRAASNMIELLNLNVAFLRNRRREALEGAFDDAFLANASDEKFRELRDLYVPRNVDGRFESFAHVIARYANQQLASSPE
jgi:uncharacterized protein (TIGR02646 family)